MHAENTEEPLTAPQCVLVRPHGKRGMAREVLVHGRDLLGGRQGALMLDEALHEVARIVDTGDAREVLDDRVGNVVATRAHRVEMFVRERRSRHGRAATSAASADSSSSDVNGSTMYSTSLACRARNTLTMQFMRSPTRVQFPARAPR